MSAETLAAPSVSLSARLAKGWARMKRNHIGFVVCALGPVLALFVLRAGASCSDRAPRTFKWILPVWSERGALQITQRFHAVAATA